MHFEVWYYERVCPWITWAVQEARWTAESIGATFEAVPLASTFTDQPSSFSMFLPFMLKIDTHLCLATPCSREELLDFLCHRWPLGPTSSQTLPDDVIPDGVFHLHGGNVQHAISLCIPSHVPVCAQPLSIQTGEQKGFIAFKGYDACGFVTYMPSCKAPYSLPEREEELALIMCLHARKGYDCRRTLLTHLVTILYHQGYDRVQVIAGLRRAYPNGPAPLFFEQGFVQKEHLGRILIKSGQDELLLLEKILP